MDNKKLIGKRIKEIRKYKGYTQESLSELISIEPSSLSGIESGRFFPSLHVLDKMSVVMHVGLHEFFKFSETELPENIDRGISDIVSKQDNKSKELIYKILKTAFVKVD
jgi:transcriptional regulator with XRE-family HTH domain